MANPEPDPALPPHRLAQGAASQQGKPPGKGKGWSSSAITLGTMGLLSTLVIGFCAAQDTFADRVTADCVDLNSRQGDGSYQVVDDDRCDDHYHGSHGAYGWYYGGARAAGRVLRGTTIRPANAHISARSGTVIQRGGFGGRGSGGS
ncbi:hypothetical protein AB0O34_06315 [Sphaerisporangium sp. NPDC088356]|uniref:hypothetical protein n=1 Tax=Sphaerisporangium sp. NPDC088356 TaxID=3154871 RepID=UPI00343AAD30